jgi:hypothetical protein
MGMVHVRVTVAGQQSAETAADTFTYLAAPTLTALVPAQGPAGGGTLVTLSGSGFASGRGGTSVRFGSSVATNVSCASATQCTATSPAGMGMVSVVVETATGTSNALPFTYQTGPMAPTVTGLDPSSGPAAGGTLMTITGSGFSPTPGATTISFGGVAAADASCSSATQCTATSPPGIGTVSVRVTVGGQQSADTPADDFTYLPFGPAPRTSAPAAVPPTLAPPSPPVRR